MNGFADDYAFLVQGLLDLFEASQDCQWLQWASQLQDKMTDLFWDKENGGYFGVTSDDPSILLRLKEGLCGGRWEVIMCCSGADSIPLGPGSTSDIVIELKFFSREKWTHKRTSL